jgi:D-alanine-D-alanine ligase
MRILLIGGGWSNEREISLKAIPAISQALKNLGHEVEFLDPALDFEHLLSKASQCDFAFINVHGVPGEDGLIQAMLSSVNCPYQGARATGSLLAFNKAAAKEIFVTQDLPTPRWQFLTGLPSTTWNPPFSFPFFVKPNTGGSSLDVSLVSSQEELRDHMEHLVSYGNTILLEEYIKGQDITCAVIEEKPLSPLLIIPPDNASFLNFTSKYTPNASQEICPAPVSSELTKTIQELALKAHKGLGLEDYSRADFIVNTAGQPFLLEVNSLPGMTTASLLPQAARQYGYSFDMLIEKLIELGLKSKGEWRE